MMWSMLKQDKALLEEKKPWWNMGTCKVVVEEWLVELWYVST